MQNFRWIDKKQLHVAEIPPSHQLPVSRLFRSDGKTSHVIMQRSPEKWREYNQAIGLQYSFFLFSPCSRYYCMTNQMQRIDLIWFWHSSLLTHQRTHDVIITSLLRQNNVATSFWRYNNIIVTLCDSWDGVIGIVAKLHRHIFYRGEYEASIMSIIWNTFLKIRRWFHIECIVVMPLRQSHNVITVYIIHIKVISFLGIVLRQMQMESICYIQI